MAVGVALVFIVPARAQPRPAAAAPNEAAANKPELLADDWPLERVELVDGTSYAGLIEREDAEQLILRQVQRQPGRPMHLIGRRFARGEVARVERLPAAAHQEQIGRASCRERV
jgi:hypothetical protein